MRRGSLLITGGAARIGAYIAKGLSKDSWDICIHYNRSSGAADRLCTEINEAGGKAVAVGANLAIRQEVDKLIAQASNKLGRPLTALINNASTFSPDTAQSLNNASFDYHMDVNLRAPLILSRTFAAQCPHAATGVIINMIDQRVLKPNPTYFTYSLSKTALYNSTKTLAQALSPHIRVNGIGPGPTLQNTDQSEDMFENEAEHTLLKHGSPPDDILGGVRYLLGAHSVTGQMIAIDGGQHLTWQTADIMAATPKGAI